MVAALEMIGAKKTAEICKKAFSIYGDKVPVDRDEREDVYNLNDKNNDRVIGQCEKELSMCEDNLPELSYQFIMKNKNSFTN